MTTTTEPRPLSPRQRDVLLGVIAYIEIHGHSPTVREIATHQGIATKAAHDHLRGLRAKGWLEWRDGCSRTMRVLQVPS